MLVRTLIEGKMMNRRRCWWTELCGLMLLLPLMASAQQLNLSVGNIPPAATRLVAVVDGGSISGTLRGSQDISAGIGSSTFSMGVPSGGPYRIRVIAFTSGSTFPAVLRSGKTTGVSVSTSGSTSASVTLGDVTGAVDPSTPTSASAGAQVTIKINITDPGDFLAGVSSGRLWSSTSPLTQNTTGAQTSGTLSSLGNGVYQFAGAVNLPTSGERSTTSSARPLSHSTTRMEPKLPFWTGRICKQAGRRCRLRHQAPRRLARLPQTDVVVRPFWDTRR